MKIAVSFRLCKVVSTVRTEQSCLYDTWMMAMVSCLRSTLMVGCDVLRVETWEVAEGGGETFVEVGFFSLKKKKRVQTRIYI